MFVELKIFKVVKLDDSQDFNQIRILKFTYNLGNLRGLLRKYIDTKFNRQARKLYF